MRRLCFPALARRPRPRARARWTSSQSKNSRLACWVDGGSIQTSVAGFNHVRPPGWRTASVTPNVIPSWRPRNSATPTTGDRSRPGPPAGLLDTAARSRSTRGLPSRAMGLDPCVKTSGRVGLHLFARLSEANRTDDAAERRRWHARVGEEFARTPSCPSWRPRRAGRVERRDAVRAAPTVINASSSCVSCPELSPARRSWRRGRRSTRPRSMPTDSPTAPTQARSPRPAASTSSLREDRLAVVGAFACRPTPAQKTTSATCSNPRHDAGGAGNIQHDQKKSTKNPEGAGRTPRSQSRRRSGKSNDELAISPCHRRIMCCAITRSRRR